MANKYKTKPGKHGTLYLYELTYVDASDPDNTGTWYAWAYDAEHAVDTFWESGANEDGWTTDGRATRVKEGR